MEGALGYSRGEIGDFLAITAITYGIGKFLMGAVSDRCNPRAFMAAGLFLTALCNFAFGSVAEYHWHLALWGLNGIFQAMGWPPCGRSLGHWFSENERGTKFASWNIAHNIGGGLVGPVAGYSMGLFGWQYAFYVPGTIALVCSIYLFFRLRDTPQSVGLPPIEEYRDDYPPGHNEDHETELSTRDLFVNYIFLNKFLWLFAGANFFVYIARYALIDWGPTYLKEVKGANLSEGGWSTLVLEWAGIPSTLLMGWLSDRLQGRRGLVSFLCMVPILFAFLGIIYAPEGRLYIVFALMAVIGFFVYPPVMLLGVAGLDLTSKKAVGTAAGFIGLFGYLGTAVQGKFLGYVSEHYGWGAALSGIVACIVLGLMLLAFTIRVRPRA